MHTFLISFAILYGRLLRWRPLLRRQDALLRSSGRKMLGKGCLRAAFFSVTGRDGKM